MTREKAALKIVMATLLALGGLLWTGCEDMGWEDRGQPRLHAAEEPKALADADEPAAAAPAAADEPAAAASAASLPEPGTSVQIPNQDGGGGFVNNPANSRGTLKVIFPSTYSGHIKQVAATAAGGFGEMLERATPNEGGNRERYYGHDPIATYPDDLTVTAFLSNGSSIYVQLPDPQRRYD